MRRAHPLHFARPVRDVDDGPVGKPRHHELDQDPQRRLDVQRRVQLAARIRQERRPPCRRLRRRPRRARADQSPRVRLRLAPRRDVPRDREDLASRTRLLIADQARHRLDPHVLAVLAPQPERRTAGLGRRQQCVPRAGQPGHVPRVTQPASAGRPAAPPARSRAARGTRGMRTGRCHPGRAARSCPTRSPRAAGNAPRSCAAPPPRGSAR